MRSVVWAGFPLCALLIAGALPAVAGNCPDNPEALGTARVMEIDTSGGPLFGTLKYQNPLNLAPKEVVLTFDDGPHRRNTKRVLDALDKECVKATFFPVGEWAEAHSELIDDIAKRGHTIGAHTHSHPRNLGQLTLAQAREQIEDGFKAVQAATDKPVAPFFRFPGLNGSEALQEYAARRSLAVFSTDVTSDDWRGIGPATIVRRTMSRLSRLGRGVLLFHDTKGTTAAAVPMLLAELKRKGYKVVHIVPQKPYKPEGTEATDVASADNVAAEALPKTQTADVPRKELQ